MSHKKNILAIFLFISLTSWGQKLSPDFTVSVGTPYKVVDADDKQYFFDGKGHAISVKTMDEKVIIQTFDVASLKEVSRKEYKDFPDKSKIQSVIQADDKLYYLFACENKKVIDVYSREIDIVKGTFAESKKLFTSSGELATATFVDIGRPILLSPLGQRRVTQVLKSYDNSKVPLRYRLKPTNRDDVTNYDVLGFYVFNTAGMDKVWGGELTMPYTEKQMNNVAFGVGRDGSAYMISKQNELSRLELLNISADLQIKAHPLGIDPDLMFERVDLRETVDGNLTCVGYYDNGLLSYKMDRAGKVLAKDDFGFSVDFANQFQKEEKTDEKREEKGKAGIPDLVVRNVSLAADGSTTVIGEQQSTYVKTYHTERGRTQKTYFYYSDVVATKYDKNGKLLWMKKLPKTQLGYRGKGMMGIRCIRGKAFHYVLYVDNEENTNPDYVTGGVPKIYEDNLGGYLMAYKIDDATGNTERHTIADLKDIKGIEAFQFKTSRIFDADDSTFLLEIYLRGKEDTMVKMMRN
jgi:hypothetical protein